MTKRNRAWFAALLLAALPACNDDEWLTETPQDFVGPENFFRNEQDAIAAINGVYGTFIGLGGPANTCGSDLYYGRNFIMVAEYPGESVTSRFGATDFRGSIDAFNFTPDLQALPEIWLCAYGAIGSANLVIANVPNIASMSETLRNRVVGEGRFLRAVHYFNLVRLFGDVPIRLDPVTSVGNLGVARSPASEVYAAIIADLEFAAQHLPARYTAPTDRGRATRSAAQALLSKVHLQYGRVHGGGAASYNAAVEMARQVRDTGVATSGARYQLLTDYESIFSPNNELNNEIVFAVQLTRVSGLGGRLAAYVAPMGSNLAGAQSSGISISFYPEWPFYQAWPDQDRRKAGTFLTSYTHHVHGPLTWTRPQPGRTNAQITAFLNQFGTPGGGPAFKKYMDPQAAAGTGDENDMILLRYADVLLMLAEAINEASGPTAEAYTALNAVRNRAGLPNLTGLSQAQFRDAVHLERRYELILEGHTYFDMQRHWEWSKQRVENHMRLGLTVAQGGQAMNAAPWGNSVPKVGVAGAMVEEKYRFYPIPNRARQANALLTQNPGW